MLVVPLVFSLNLMDSRSTMHETVFVYSCFCFHKLLGVTRATER